MVFLNCLNTKKVLIKLKLRRKMHESPRNNKRIY